MSRNLLLLSLGHAFTDFYVGFFPMYMVLAGLDIPKASAIATLTHILANLSHPLFGIFVDRVRGRWFLPVSVLGTALFMTFLGWAGRSYGIIFLAVLIGKLFNAAFHPGGSRLAAREGHPTRSFGIFILIGTLGLALSQFTLERFSEKFGLQNIPWLTLPALLYLAFYMMTGPGNPAAAEEKDPAPFFESLKPHRAHMTRLYFLIAIQTMIQAALVFSLPALFKGWAFPKWAWGLGSFFYIGAGSMGMLYFALYGIHFDSRKVVMGLMTVMTPLYLLFLKFGHHSPWVSGAILIPLSISTFCIQPYVVTVGQQLMPRHAGIVSGILMGFAWALGSSFTAFVGWFTRFGFDWWGGGLVPGLLMLSIFPLAGVGLAYRLPRNVS